MNITELYEMQKVLDDRIIKEKCLEDQDLLPNTVLALCVEIGEMANNWRGFKHWSNDQEPRTRVMIACQECGGSGRGYSDYCGNCHGGYIGEKNLLLEEYVDCLHFFLSIARQYNWKDNVLYFVEDAVEELREAGFDGGITGAILEMKYYLMKMYMENKPNKKLEETFGYSTKEFHFRGAFFIFMCLGLVGFGFTFEQIYQAYLDKNKINHERQSNGY